MHIQREKPVRSIPWEISDKEGDPMRIKNSSWITVSKDPGDVCPVFRRQFAAEKQPAEAELEITALGIYEAEINGRRVSDYVLAPGWTSYDHRLQVQTYDVTDMLKDENDLQVTVGRGWFLSPMPGWMDSADKRRRCNQPCGLIASLHIVYADGTEETILTDESWQWANSRILFSEIYDGETCDAYSDREARDADSYPEAGRSGASHGRHHELHEHGNPCSVARSSDGNNVVLLSEAQGRV